jgi:hypothetical protein
MIWSRTVCDILSFGGRLFGGGDNSVPVELKLTAGVVVFS